ncbi:MAG: PilC/PilY family type IV pilus protein, partial [Arenicellales bacterium]|nr:PilC/PilY family type IV pilus protein [Arenicellales bacterium]
GLSTPSVIDLDGDGMADRVYAGSLSGQLWAFDIGSANTADWAIAHTGDSPLFTAVNNLGGSQPITTQPQVIRQPVISDGPDPNVLVLFGTGQYLIEADKTTTDTQSFYGVWDRSDGNLDRADLQAQAFLADIGASGRVIAPAEVDYAGASGSIEYGWYLDLDPGERVVSDYLVRGEMVYFNTQIPDDRPCAFGGSGWLMSIKTADGGSADADAPEFDYNGDGIIDSSDTVTITGSGGQDEAYAYAGEKFDTSKGLPAAPAIIGNKRYTTGTQTSQNPAEEGAQMDTSIIADLEPGPKGRLSWDQLNPY